MSEIVKLKSFDGRLFEVGMDIVVQSPFIIDLMKESAGTGVNEIMIPHVPGDILEKIIDSCEKHAKKPEGSYWSFKSSMKKYDAQYAKVFDDSTLLTLGKAACFLKIPSLIDVTSQELSDRLMLKTRREIRELFGITEFVDEEKIKEELDMLAGFKLKYAPE